MCTIDVRLPESPSSLESLANEYESDLNSSPRLGVLVKADTNGKSGRFPVD